jgi:homoserine O-succinyltransferase
MERRLDEIQVPLYIIIWQNQNFASGEPPVFCDIIASLEFILLEGKQYRMPIKIPSKLPAAAALRAENIFVMDERRATRQDIRPLRVAIVNLMPTKSETELQLLRLLGGTPLQVEATLVQMSSHTSRNTPPEHLSAFYKRFGDIEDECFDGMIITGAPVENLEFGDVDYWDELCGIMDWTNRRVYSTFHICWGAQAGLFRHYGIQKRPLPQKLTGVFAHYSPVPNHPLMRGFDDVYYVPHSRYTTILAEDVESHSRLGILSLSGEAGVHIVASSDNKKIFVTGHSEYDRDTLALEYERDLKKYGENAPKPQGYFPGGDSGLAPLLNWRAHASLLFYNWINFIIYQNTPYDLSSLTKIAKHKC